MSTRSARRELVAYALIVGVTSALVFLVGADGGSFAALLGANVPFSAIAFVCPALGAVIVSAASRTSRRLATGLRLPFRAGLSWAVAVVAMPLVVLLGAVTLSTGTDASATAGGLALSAGLYLLSATGEQIGWMGFVLPRLLPRWGELRSGIVIGAAWAALHVVPYAQAGNTWPWIAGQCLFTLCFAVFLVQLTVRSGGSIWPAVVAHAAYNTTWTLTAGDGEGYSPWLTAALTALLVIALRSLPVPAGTRGRSASPTTDRAG